MAFCNAESAWPRYIYHLQKPLVSGLAVFDLQCRNSLINPDQTINYVTAHNRPSLCILGIIENIKIQNELFVAMENLDWILLFIFQFFDEDEDVGDDVLKMMMKKMIPLFTLLSANFPTVAFVGD